MADLPQDIDNSHKISRRSYYSNKSYYSQTHLNSVDMSSKRHCYSQLSLLVYSVKNFEGNWSHHCYNRFIVLSDIVMSGLDSIC